MHQLDSLKGGESKKTKYHCGTLVGNWEEERRLFGVVPSKLPSDAPMDAGTTYTTSFKAPTSSEMVQAKPASCFTANAPKELLFFHGDFTDPERHQLALSEVCYTDRNKLTYTNDATLDMPGISQRQVRTKALRRAMGLSASAEDGTAPHANAATVRESNLIRSLNTAVGENTVSNESAFLQSRGDGYTPSSLPPVGRVAERSRLLTTKQVTVDATGEYLYEHLEHYPMTSSTRFGEFVLWRDNPMYKTKLCVEYEKN